MARRPKTKSLSCSGRLRRPRRKNWPQQALSIAQPSSWRKSSVQSTNVNLKSSAFKTGCASAQLAHCLEHIKVMMFAWSKKLSMN